MQNYIDLSMFPKRKVGKKEHIIWEDVNNIITTFQYKEIKGELIVNYKEKRGKVHYLTIKYNNNECEIASSNLSKVKLGRVTGKFVRGHIYKIGEVVNNNVLIIDLIRKKNSRGDNILAYKVKCTESEVEYEATQYNLKYGYGSPYASGIIASHLNWLYNEKHLLKYLVQPEIAKQVSIGSDQKIEVKCEYCDYKKLVTVHNFVKKGFNCPFCSTNLSYPERFLMAYLRIKNIEYVHQYKLKNQIRYIDFYLPRNNIAIECHGMQHYEETSLLWKDSLKNTLISDNIKRQYCKENNIKLIELDCRKSDFDFIRQSIFNSELENINEEEVKNIKGLMIEYLNDDKTLNILKDYQEGVLSINKISKKYNVSHKTVTNIASKFGARENRNMHKPVYCITNDIKYKSIAEANLNTGIPIYKIRNACNNDGIVNFKNEITYWNYIIDDIV